MDEDLVIVDLPLSEMLPGLLDLPGAPSHDVVGGPLLRYLERNGSVTWAALAQLSPAQIAAIPHVGPIRTGKVMSGLAHLVGATSALRQKRQSSDSGSIDDELLQSLTGIASWAVGTGRDGSMLDAILAAADPTEIDGPAAEVAWLAEIPVSSVASPVLASRYDPVLAAQTLLDSFNERETATLERILAFDGTAPTLEQLGSRFGVTRERIRQIEVGVAQRIRTAVADPTGAALRTASDVLRERLGSVVPAEDLVAEFASNPPDELDRLILHLAGPYHFDGDWCILRSVRDLKALVVAAFDAVAVEGIAQNDALRDSLEEQGVRPRYVDKVLASAQWLKVVPGQVVDWTGSYASKAVICLELAGRPMSIAELVEFIEPESERGLANQLGADERITRVGMGRYALAHWGLGEYAGIAATMAERLAGGQVLLETLKQQLAEEFGVSPNSVAIMATTHPAFVCNGGQVMLRPADQPYVPNADLEGTRNCYLVDGVWSWRVPVDADILRGSGRPIPEAFALHLGGAPLERTSVSSEVGDVGVYWNQYPSIGSLRAAARHLDAELGDWLFVRRTQPSAIEFRVLRARDVPQDPEGQLLALIGAGNRAVDLEVALSDALGLHSTVNGDLSEEREALRARGEKELVELLDEALA